MTYWIVVGLPDNFEIATKRGFDMFGFKSTRRRESGEMRPGDKLVFYLTGAKAFAGIATVTSESYEEHNTVFKSEKKPDEDFPFRVKTKADIALTEDRWLSVPDYVPLLDFTRRGAMKSWGMAFQGNLHKISDHDYKLLERDMCARAKKKPPTAKAKPAAKAAAKRTAKAPVKRAAKKPAARKKPAKPPARAKSPARRRWPKFLG